MQLKQKLLSNPLLVFLFIYLSPFIIEIFFSEWSNREYRIRLGWAVMSIASCYIFRFKPLIALISLFFIVTSSIDIGYAIVFGGIFTRTSSSIDAVAQTNAQEMLEFLQSYFDPFVILVVALYVITSVFLLFKLVCPGLPEKKVNRSIVLFFFSVLCSYVVLFSAVKHQYYKVIPGIAGAYPTYRGKMAPLSTEIKARIEQAENNTGKFVNAIDAPQTYIFIIGESTARAHMSLYGYRRNTNPKLSKRDDLIIFDNVISNFAQTLPSLCHGLTLAVTDGDISCKKALSTMDAANIAGFETWWISNQLPLNGTYSAIARQAQHTLFMSDLQFGKEVEQYDGLILPELDKALAAKARKKVIFIHLMGSHLKYDKRYPNDDFNKFDSPPYFAYTDDLSTQQKYYIDTYDNSILYNDWLVDEVIGRLKKTQGEGIAALNYMSDHGEQVYDTIDHKGHGPDSVTKNTMDIPFLVWLSKGYRDKFREHSQYLQNNTHKPYMLDYYFHFSLAMMNVLSPFYIDDYSLFSRSLHTRKRLVYGKDYDVKFAL